MQHQDPIQVLSPLEIKTQNGALVETFAGISKYQNFHSIHSSGGFGKMFFHHHHGNGFDIWYSEYDTKENSKLHARADIPVLELHIPFEKHIVSKWDGYYADGQREKQFDLSFAPFIDTVSILDKNNHYSTFDVHYSESYLRRFDHIQSVAKFLEKVEQDKPANLIGEARYLTPAMIAVINSTLYHKVDPALAGLYYEANALMLLTLVLDHVCQKQDTLFSAFDKECALQVRDTITQDFSTIYSVNDLCRLTGTNEIKLQHCFKELFGTTIFDYHHNLRMEYARKLLLDTSFSIQSVALHCGYSDNANLTAAFKRKYGSSPEKFRKNC